MKEYYFINGEVYPVMSAQEGIQIFLDNPFAQFTAQQYLKKFPAIWKRTRGTTVPKSAVKDVKSLWQYMIQQKLVQKATPGEIRKFNNEEKPVRSAKPKSDRKKSSPAKKGVSGVYDPNIFKVVFLAGGPGSGKSAIAKVLFGLQGNFSYTGLKSVNSDRFFEYLLKKEGIPSDFRNMPKEQFEKITQGEGSIRDRAKNLNVAQFDSWIKGRLGVIIDGTGDNAKKLINQAKYLKDTYGYEPFMVFVNTTLNKAIERNNKRDRKLPEALVREIWNSAQQALKEYKAYFKSNFVEIDNSRDVSKIEIDKKIQKEVAAFLRKPNTNAKAKQWIESELSKKKGISKSSMSKSLTAGYPHRKTSGEGFEKIVIAEPMDDATRERMITRFEAEGWDAKPNFGGGITAIKKTSKKSKGISGSLYQKFQEVAKKTNFNLRGASLPAFLKWMNANAKELFGKSIATKKWFTLLDEYPQIMDAMASAQIDTEPLEDESEVKVERYYAKSKK
jgi:predicted kinase